MNQTRILENTLCKDHIERKYKQIMDNICDTAVQNMEIMGYKNIVKYNPKTEELTITTEHVLPKTLKYIECDITLYGN